jgi:hypothetical protein
MEFMVSYYIARGLWYHGVDENVIVENLMGFGGCKEEEKKKEKRERGNENITRAIALRLDL